MFFSLLIVQCFIFVKLIVIHIIEHYYYFNMDIDCSQDLHWLKIKDY